MYGFKRIGGFAVTGRVLKDSSTPFYRSRIHRSFRWIFFVPIFVMRFVRRVISPMVLINEVRDFFHHVAQGPHVRFLVPGNQGVVCTFIDRKRD